MKKLIVAATLTLFAATAQAECIVADPSPTPLNVRTAPNGRIISTLDNGQSVSIIDHAADENSREWVYVSDPENDRPIGWVVRDYVVCKGEMAPRGARRSKNCDSLSYQRNSIFKRAGYCFEDSRTNSEFWKCGMPIRRPSQHSFVRP